MKKITLFIFAAMVAFTNTSAQVLTEGQSTEENGSPETTAPSTAVAASKNRSWTDIGVDVNFDKKVYGITIGGSTENNKIGYFITGASIGFGKASPFTLLAGYGLNYRYSNNSIMVHGALYPYIGYLSYDYDEYIDINKTIEKQKHEFHYGAMADVKFGLNIYTTKKGSKGYLTVGYYISAPKFKTEGMFDNGSWRFGLSVGI